jgi:hypothetical protein
VTTPDPSHHTKIPNTSSSILRILLLSLTRFQPPLLWEIKSKQAFNPDSFFFLGVSTVATWPWQQLLLLLLLSRFGLLLLPFLAGCCEGPATALTAVCSVVLREPIQLLYYQSGWSIHCHKIPVRLGLMFPYIGRTSQGYWEQYFHTSRLVHQCMAIPGSM